MLKYHQRGLFFALFCALLFVFATGGTALATEVEEVNGLYVIATLPGSDTPLPVKYYGDIAGSVAASPCYITVPAGTTQITIKKDPNLNTDYTFTSLRVYKPPYKAADKYPLDAGAEFSVTVPATATRQNPYRINSAIKNSNGADTSNTIFFYCVEENGPNPFVTPDRQEVAEGSTVSLNVYGTGNPAQPVEWYYGYYDSNSSTRIYEKLEGETGADLNITAVQDSLNLGSFNEETSQYSLRFYTKIGTYISNEVYVTVNGTPVSKPDIKSLDASHWGSYAGAKLWLNVGAAFNDTVAAETPVKFYLTAAENGTPDTAIAGTLVESTVAAVPGAAAEDYKDLGFLVQDLPAGSYWLAIQLGTDNPSYSYRAFTVYPGVKEYVKASLDKMISWYQTKIFVKDGIYVGLSERRDGTDWDAWIFPNYGYAVTDPLLAGADGKTYLDGLEAALKSRDAGGTLNSPKDDFRYVAALCAVGADPRNFNGRNLVAELIGHAYNADGTLKLGKDGVLDLKIDILTVSYLLLGAEIAGATEAEGYTDALKKAGIKAILPTVEMSVDERSDISMISSSDWLAMQSYPLYFLQDDLEYGDRIRDAVGKMAAMVSTHLYANGGVTMNWPGVSSPGSFDTPLPATAYAVNPNSMAVMLNALVLFGATAEDLGSNAWQEDWGTYMTALLSLQMDDGSVGFNGGSNDMATYQTLGALVELHTGRSCFVNARDTYLSKYPDYAAQITAPFISDGSGARLSAGEGKVTFTSNEGGQAYYAVVDRGAAAPVIDTSGAGTDCVSGVNTIVIGDLVDSSAKDVYLLVKDGDGHSSKTLQISMADSSADTGAPVITLNGASAITLNLGESFTDPGATATDNVDEDLTDRITVGGDTVDVNTPGTYTITYNVSDAAGNSAAQVTRTVTVQGTETGDGDVNRDGKVNVMDMILVGQHFNESGAAGWISADTNKDGKIDVSDLIFIGQHWKD
ncbi:hypothetical protein Dtox_1975 [Desulfofarcimen acetoxidans DSM 771]|uniref:Dockerin domain-containing protein n=1 Tax=Desulfofarcimen acetoxidans (strain ATCC 49208 / DSM 771 / KCTC 5769 / VKM B-1644 / 5575) TaxID=485916 RepID=C8VYD0_DESAS|nr:immunoglobulin-like domain-containing protein [Desulfofarcimen acetoxidans]ACV62811.1 hypothetical protein Dtox_1975 [Desulfofarcimen acetoxidans DSM 771]